jgi:anaerobic selenocysteine-containing dehydrogenase
VTTGRRKSRVSGAPEVFGELPITVMAEEMQTPGEGQIKALITVASNPVLSAPGGPRIAQALEGLDFMLSLDIYVNETSRHADVILPGLSPLEDLHFDVAFPQLSHRNHARFSGPVFDAPAGTPQEWQTILRLCALLEGRGLGVDVQQLDDEAIEADVRRFAGDNTPAILAALQPWRGPERLIDLQLRVGPYGDQLGRKPEGLTLAKVKAASTVEGGGIDLGALTPRIPEVLRTPSGKIELAPPSILADFSQVKAEPLPNPAAFSLIGRRDVRSGNSWMHNLPLLAKGPERCTLLINPGDAERLGLAEFARVRSAAGELVARVERSADMSPGVISLPHGWGHDLDGVQLGVARERPGVNMNALLDDAARDPLSGNAVLSGIAVEVTSA